MEGVGAGGSRPDRRPGPQRGSEGLQWVRTVGIEEQKSHWGVSVTTCLWGQGVCALPDVSSLGGCEDSGAAKGEGHVWGTQKGSFHLGQISSFQWVIQVEMPRRLFENSRAKINGQYSLG